MTHNNNEDNEKKKPGIYDWTCTLCEQDFESKYTPKHCPYCNNKTLLKPDLPLELLEEIGFEYLLFDDEPEHQILLFELLSVFNHMYGTDWMIERVDRIREQTKVLRIKFELPNREENSGKK
jgi:DNA-directed RNA polymerase subunit RPC12/RpoP